MAECDDDGATEVGKAEDLVEAQPSMSFRE